MSYQTIRAVLEAQANESSAPLSDRDKLLLEAFRQLTIVLESDLTQIKGALGHVARLVEDGRSSR